MISAIDAPVEFEVSIGEHLKLAQWSNEKLPLLFEVRLSQWRNGTLPSFKIGIGEHLKLAHWSNENLPLSFD